MSCVICFDIVKFQFLANGMLCDKCYQIIRNIDEYRNYITLSDEWLKNNLGSNEGIFKMRIKIIKELKISINHWTEMIKFNMNHPELINEKKERINKISLLIEDI